MRRALAWGVAAVLCGSAPAAADAPRVLHRSTIGGPVALPLTACAGALTGAASDAAPLIGAAPGRPDELRAVYHAHGERLQIAAASHDGGRTWTRRAIPRATRCLGGPAERFMTVNPLFDVGAGGVAYFGQSWFNQPHNDLDEWRYGVTVHRRDGQASAFAPDVPPPGGERAAQNAAVAADAVDPERVAVLWTQMTQVPNPITYTPLPNELRFAQSSDGGSTWSTPRVVHRAEGERLIVNSRVTRLEDGSLVVVFDEANLRDFPTAQLRLSGAPLAVYAMRSRDGVEWSHPVPIATGHFHDSSDERPEGESGDGLLAAAKLDVAAGPGGEVIATWPQEGATLQVARSHDGGETWQPPEDTVALPRDAFNTAVALDGRGRAGIFYYDFRHDVAGDDEFTVQPRFAAETKHGWRDVALDAPFDLDATASCTRMIDPDPLDLTRACEPGSHAGSLGVYQDVEGLPKGFGVAYSVGGALAGDGYTDARYARVTTDG